MPRLVTQSLQSIDVMLSPALRGHLVLDDRFAAGADGSSADSVKTFAVQPHPTQWRAMPNALAPRSPAPHPPHHTNKATPKLRRGSTPSAQRWSASARSDRRTSLTQLNSTSSLRSSMSASNAGSSRPPRFRSKSASEADHGAAEMESVEIFAATWNMNNLKECTDSLEELLGVGNYQYDVYAVGTQEFLGNRALWEQALLSAVGDSYELLHGQELMAIKLTIMIRKSLRRYVRKIESADLPTKLGGLIKTKGAVGISMTLGRSSFLFINSHLTAHQNNVKERNHDHHTICKELALPLDAHNSRKLALVSTPSRKTKRRSPVYTKYDYTFWMGDLNYRLDGVTRDDVVQAVTNRDWKRLQSCDQLLKERHQFNVFEGFQEHMLTFGPTYKFDRSSNIYDSSKKQRIPAWTDRILFRYVSFIVSTSNFLVVYVDWLLVCIKRDTMYV